MLGVVRVCMAWVRRVRRALMASRKAAEVVEGGAATPGAQGVEGADRAGQQGTPAASCGALHGLCSRPGLCKHAAAVVTECAVYTFMVPYAARVCLRMF